MGVDELAARPLARALRPGVGEFPTAEDPRVVDDLPHLLDGGFGGESGVDRSAEALDLSRRGVDEDSARPQVRAQRAGAGGLPLGWNQRVAQELPQVADGGLRERNHANGSAEALRCSFSGEPEGAQNFNAPR